MSSTATPPPVTRSRKRKGGEGLRIHQAIARKLGIAILNSTHEPGSSLGGEIEASERLGVSRTAYREAIRILIAKGLIESRPKAGTHVLPRRRWNLLDPDILAWMFSEKPDRDFVRDLFELRGIIEPEAAALAAERRHDGHLAGMRQALDGMRVHGLACGEGQAADQDFHSTMLEAAGNDALTSLIGSVGAAVRWTTHFKQSNSPAPRNSLPEHEAVHQAIAAGDPDGARRAMRVLLEYARSDVVDSIA
ncbi:FadR/GntR family transcriptional regulator [Novosphingobium sp. SG707]|uniref:FadR/GntR family transcriptional regulator n=1 Tax=Novosphingobium sp. SG707 TaxID=2586996 RepID=UPI0014488DCB|nr:FadR/GntR family transcriptional regulator [Novosphingobium sp. SG707]NKI99162.1 DNA-binding FadR family transcriptional regulator [Novosphingobium sp. SG707]